MLICQGAQLFVQALMVHTAAVLDAQRHTELVRLLAASHHGHIYSNQFGHVGWDTCGSPVTDLLVIAKVEIDRADRIDASIGHWLDRWNKIRYTGFVVQESWADEPVRYFDTRVEADAIANVDAQGARLLLRGCASIQADLHVVVVARCLVPGRAVDMTGCRIDQNGPADFFTVRCELPNTLRLDRSPLYPANAAQFEPPIRFDLLHNGTQGIDVSGQGNRRQVTFDFPFCHQGAFAGAC